MLHETPSLKPRSLGRRSQYPRSPENRLLLFLLLSLLMLELLGGVVVAVAVAVDDAVVVAVAVAVAAAVLLLFRYLSNGGDPFHYRL